MLSFRASLAFVLSAALAASPAFAAKAHHARTSGHESVSSHTSTSDASTKRASRSSRHASAKDRASDTASSSDRTSRRSRTRASRKASTNDSASSATSEPTSGSRRHHGKHGSRSVVAAAAAPHRSHGQQAIDSARVTEIQQALIREHYFTGEANGEWDEATKAAMLKYQADQGWQTKLTPDSRALKKLGLGPDYSNAINAKNSSFAPPPSASTIPPVQSAGFAAAAGVNQ
jgi:hypothetical protein